MIRLRWRCSTVLALLLLIGGCATYPVNPPVKSTAAN
jgi:hypothetical protein